ncbi:MAG: putative membrane protein, partial [Cyanobium sp.]
DDLIAIEVIWQPEGAGEVLSTEELLTAYPQLQHL